MADYQASDLILRLKEGIINYDESAVKTAAQEVINTGVNPDRAIAAGLVAGMKVMGERYDRAEIFLPEILICIEIFYAGFNILKGGTGKKDLPSEKTGGIVIGTVAGDIHDLGKNIVKIMLETSGFVVHDLGASVPAENFLNEQKNTGSQIVALSTMMTTTMMEMEKIIGLIRTQKLNAWVMIGGAAVTPEVARRFKADGFAPNAFAAVTVAKKLLAGER